MENTRIADIFEEIADLLELKSANPFRIRSYRNAAQTVRNHSESLADMVARHEDVSNLPNIGGATADKIHEILRRGTCKRLESLRKEVPDGLTGLLSIPDLGPRTVMQLNHDLDIDSMAKLEEACKNHDVQNVEGMGEKTEQKILRGIATVKRTRGRMRLSIAAEQLEPLRCLLSDSPYVKRYEVAGSFRRGKETVGDLDILVEAADRKAAAGDILAYKNIEETIEKGQEKLSLRLVGGCRVDVRFFDTKSFGAALLYFTGSKAHNIHLRKRARKHDWKLNEYGLFKNQNKLAAKTEEKVYNRLGLAWIPPELREGRGEIDRAEKDKLPALVKTDDIRGDFQCHTSASDGEHSIREMAEAAQAMGWSYLAITDHSKRVAMANGLDDDACRRHADEIRKVNDTLDDFWLMAGIEVDILKDGSLDLREKTLKELDWVVGSIHYDRNQSQGAMTDRMVAAVESGLIHCLGHPLGRIIGRRNPVNVDFERVIQACVKHGVCLEINAQPERLDLPDTYCRRALKAGARFTIGTDAHTRDNFDLMPYGVTVARRGWISKKDVLNTLTSGQLKKKLDAGSLY